MTDLLQSLGKVSELWLSPDHPLRAETVSALQVSTGLHRRQIESALANCFEELTLPKLTNFAATLTRSPKEAMEVWHILPANAFTAWVPGAVISFLLGHRSLLKPSVREPVFAGAWKKSLEQVDPALAKRTEIISWDPAKAKQARAVIAYGSDETLQKIRATLAPGARFAGFGHKLSVGIIFEEVLHIGAQDELLAGVRSAADPFRLQGCLSPQILYVQDKRFRLWPELAATLDVAPRVATFEEWDVLSKELGKFAPYLSCVGYAGEKEREAFLAQELEPYQVSRVCPIGEMQRPPLAWQNGGIDLVNLLN